MLTLCPRSDESAGKGRSTRVRKGGTSLKTTLVTAAWTAVRVKGSYLQAQFLRLNPTRREEGDPGRRGLHVHCRLPHAEKTALSIASWR